jgi:hypothetical protein
MIDNFAAVLDSSAVLNDVVLLGSRTAASPPAYRDPTKVFRQRAEECQPAGSSAGAWPGRPG